MTPRLIRPIASYGDERGEGAPASSEREEARLELACVWGAGHMLVAGSDRDEARDLLERVLRRIEPLGTVRARACDPDPESTLDGLFLLSEEGGPIPLGRRERRLALLRLLEKARSARRSVFIVVDDGDDATVEQLERLRASVEVSPDAIERLRLVLLGGSPLIAKLGDRAARALSSRITSRIRIGGSRAAHEVASARRVHAPRVPPFAIAAGVSFALLAYGATRSVFPPAPERGEVSVAPARSASSEPMPPTAVAAVAYVSSSLRGDEPFLGGDLRIPVHREWTTGSALSPPPAPAVGLPAVSPPAAVAHTAPPAIRHAVAVVAAAKPPVPVRVAPQLAAGSSIAELVARFR